MAARSDSSSPPKLTGKNQAQIDQLNHDLNGLMNASQEGDQSIMDQYSATNSDLFEKDLAAIQVWRQLNHDW